MKNLNPRTKLTSLLAATCLALAPAALAVDPPPDGGYPNSNTAEGDNALFSLTTGSDNTAIGNSALGSNTTASFNTATGAFALSSNTTGSFNTATGGGALDSNTTGFNNTANGSGALSGNTTGVGNTANGVAALTSDTTGSDNTADGVSALFVNTSGNANTASGENALFNNTSGSSNIALGFNAGFSLTTGNSNIDIGNIGVAGESRAIRIGTKQTHKATFIAGISGATVAGGVGVIVDVNGHLGTVVSSARFKEAIKPMDKTSEAILSLQPVTFRYKKALDPEGIPQFGLVAEDVAKVDPDLVARDEAGKPYSVRYEAVNAMLLNEFLKEHRKNEEQGRKIEVLEAQVAQQQRESKATISQMQSALKEQAAEIQKVNVRLAADQSALHVVVNSH